MDPLSDERLPPKKIRVWSNVPNKTSNVDLFLWIYGQGYLPSSIRSNGETMRAFGLRGISCLP
jgi:hypothetical protein